MHDFTFLVTTQHKIHLYQQTINCRQRCSVNLDLLVSKSFNFLDLGPGLWETAQGCFALPISCWLELSFRNHLISLCHFSRTFEGVELVAWYVIVQLHSIKYIYMHAAAHVSCTCLQLHTVWISALNVNVCFLGRVLIFSNTSTRGEGALHVS